MEKILTSFTHAGQFYHIKFQFPISKLILRALLFGKDSTLGKLAFVSVSPVNPYLPLLLKNKQIKSEFKLFVFYWRVGGNGTPESEVRFPGWLKVQSWQL